MSGVVYEYTCGKCNSSYYGETERHLKVRSGQHIGISPLTFKKTKPSKESSIRDCLLQCDNNPLFGEFTTLAQGNKKYLLEIKKSFSIKRDQLVLNTNQCFCYATFIRHGLMSLVFFSCDNCNFYNLSRC